MRAGKLKYKLQLLEPKRAAGRMAEKVTYELTKTVWAERVTMAGHRSEEVGEHFADYAASYNIRDVHKVDEHWRVRQLGGYLYTVVAIVLNHDRGMLTLICERVNE